VWALLGEAFRLLAAHLYLFTLISLTIWLPGHVLRNYFEFFGPPDDVAIQSLRVVLIFQLLFDPLVVSATLSALSRIKRGLPVDYGTAMAQGLAAWGRLFFVRFIINSAVALPALGGLALNPAGPFGVAAGFGLLLLAALVLFGLVRYAVVDSVVVLEGATVWNAWPPAARLTAGRRWPIAGAAAVLFACLVGAAMLTAFLFRLLPDLNHFVLRVMVDCALAVAQSAFTITFFVFYWRARHATA
jgi:hypothetical protein